MKDFLRQNGILLLAIALLLSILIGALSLVMGGQADPLSDLMGVLTTPIRRGGCGGLRHHRDRRPGGGGG